MAELVEGFKLLGSLEDFTFYKLPTSKKNYVKRKSGPTREMIHTKPNYAITRKNIKAFGGASSAASVVKKAMGVMPKVPDYHFFGNLTALMKIIEKKDTVHPLGQRDVRLSQYPQLLEGLQISRRNPFESLVQNPVVYAVSRQDCTAELTIPALLPGVNFHGIGNFPFYRWRIDLGVAPDMFYNEHGKHRPRNYYPANFRKTIISDWFYVNKEADSTFIEMAFTQLPPDNDFSLILTVSIQFGKVDRDGETRFVNYAAAGKVLAVA